MWNYFLLYRNQLLYDVGEEMRNNVWLRLIFLVLILSGYVLAENTVLNSASYIKMPSPYESGGQYVHPSILKFKEPWHDFLYWMVATPYPGADSSKENPVILASLDGMNWELKAIVDETGLREPYSSDPCLVYDGGQLWVYWRYLGPEPTLQKIYRAKSADGVTWQPKELVLEGERNSMCSPSILIREGRWYMYYSDFDGRIYQRTSENGLNWGEKIPQQLLLEVNENFMMKTVKNTHLEVRETRTGLLMIVMGDSLKYGMNLYLFSGFADTSNWYGSFEPLIKVAPGSWDGFSLYKTSFLVDESEDTAVKLQPKLRIWYSAYRMNPMVFHIAYTESLLERWNFDYNLEINPWRYQDQGLAFLGYPNAEGVAWLEHHRNKALVQAELKLPEGGAKAGYAGLILRYKNRNSLAGFTIAAGKALLWVEHGGKREERVMELGESLAALKSCHLKLTAENQVYAAYLNQKQILRLVSNLKLENGDSGLIGYRNNYYFKDILVK